MKKFCESLREHEMKITNFLKNEVINKRTTGVKKIEINMSKIKNTLKLEIIVIIQGNIEVLHIASII